MSVRSLGTCGKGTHSDQTPYYLSDGPPNRQQGQEVLMTPRNELEEECPVHWQVSADTETT